MGTRPLLGAAFSFDKIRCRSQDLPKQKGKDLDWSEFLKSRVVWTNILSIVSVFLVKFGIELSPEQQAEVLTAVVTLSNILSLAFKATPKV